MGACASRPEKGRCSCLGSTSLEKSNNKDRNNKTIIKNTETNNKNGRCRICKRIKRRGRRIRNQLLSNTNKNNNHVITNPAFQGSLEPRWADADSVLDSELEDEFYSVHDDVFSANGSESVSGLTPRAVYADEVSFGAGDDETQLTTTKTLVDNDNIHCNNCGILSNACLPCLASPHVITCVEKKRSSSPGTPRRKLAVKLSFKSREESHPTSSLLSPKALFRRPIAGATVPYCPIDKKMPGCWSFIEPSSFKVRGQSYFRDKKKDFAPNCAAFHPLGVDIFLCPRKIHHIAKFVELPVVCASDEAPSILVVNVQIPLYPAAIFQSENDGEGLSLVMYFKLSETYSKELPLQFRENITRLINDEVERVKSFPIDSIVPFRERLKILSRLVNVDDLQLTATEKKLISTYNEKPVLSRPQHEFYLGENYFEVDLDMHRFSYISRKGIQQIQDRLKLCILDFGLTIQGNKADDLPEHMLCSIRINEIDHTKYSQLGC